MSASRITMNHRREKNMKEKKTIHGFFVLWANELCAHLFQRIFLNCDKKLC
jgi:hypothetical protein